jgi:repressor LexA
MAHTPKGRTREKVWRFVRERLLAGDPPTVREVQAAFGFRAVESARAHLTALVEAGLLVQETGRSRGWRLPSHGRGGGASRPVMVPVLGRVQAGALTTALEEPEGRVAATPVPGAELFALRVRGDSMRGAGILDGDLVIVRRQETAEDGEIVVALVGEEATVKRLRWRRTSGTGLTF